MQKLTSSQSWPTETAQIPLNKGLFATIDATDFLEVAKFHWTTRKSHSRIYAVRKYKQYGRSITVFMHRSLVHAQPGFEIHHVNGCTLDNRRSNLQPMTTARHHELHNLERITRRNRSEV